MITKWTILGPDEKIKKHKLLLQCDLRDILSIVKRLGAVCSRPERLISNDYNFVIYLLDYNKEIEEKIKTEIERIISAKSTRRSSPQPKVETINEEINIPVPELEIKEKPVPIEVKKAETKEEKREKIKEVLLGPIVPGKAPVEKKFEAKPVETGKEIKKEEIEEKKEFKEKEYERLKLKWSIELPLNPMLSFQTLITGSHNRFAHAASMAVVENPGVMYNPILIYGGIGAGKSHFIHSISYGLSSRIGQKNIFVTNGVKFSIGVSLAIKEGFIDKLEKIINECKVIIMDDLHLMLINNVNKHFISKIIEGSMQANKQVVFSSLFPPSELEPLENLLGINLSQGWMVDIKQPNPQVYRMILNQLLSNMDVKLAEGDINKFFVSRSMNFKNVSKYLFRMKKFERYLISLSQSLLHQDILAILLGEKDDTSLMTEADLRNVSVDIERFKDNRCFYKWGFFYPKGMKDYLNYVFFKLNDVSKKYLSMDLIWNTVFIEEYDTDETYGLPFKIGNYLLDKNTNGVIILGPPSNAPLSSKEIEFSHLSEKICESMNIKFGFISFTKLKGDSSYLNSLLELI
jgi:chromosomal replication initiation ATPase DnaA